MPSLTPQQIESLNPPAEPEAKNPAHHEHPHEHPSSPRTPR
jgi:hypothetical protein